MFRSRRCQALVARALLAGVGLDRLWSDDGPTPEARLLAEAGHLPLGRRERALCRVAWMVWGGLSGVTLGDLLDLMDSEDLATVADLLRAMSAGADEVDAWLRAHAPPRGARPAAAGGGTLPDPGGLDAVRLIRGDAGRGGSPALAPGPDTGPDDAPPAAAR